jgi:2-polyprenyl-6-methoxyphenol hydroxylase-like FAD-dependent oxidoreductase
MRVRGLSRLKIAKTLMIRPVLPHQGAGATSAIEDAEALAFTLRDATAMSVPSALLRTFAIRSKRAIKFQTASRARGLHGKLDTEDGAKALEGWIYPGAQKWAEEHPDMVAT